MIYIDAENLDYPRFEGDVDLEPQRSWQIVTETTMPENDDRLMMVCEIMPILVNHSWVQQWQIRPKTADEIALENKPPKHMLDL